MQEVIQATGSTSKQEADQQTGCTILQVYTSSVLGTLCLLALYCHPEASKLHNLMTTSMFFELLALLL